MCAYFVGRMTLLHCITFSRIKKDFVHQKDEFVPLGLNFRVRCGFDTSFVCFCGNVAERHINVLWLKNAEQNL